MKHLFKAAALVLGLVTLTACSSGNIQSSGMSLFEQAKASLKKPTGQAVDPRKVITRSMIDAANTPVIIVEALNTNQIGSLINHPSSNNGEFWIGADGSSLRTKNGILIETRGMGPDLMASEVTTVLINGHHSVRRMGFLDGANQLVTHTYHCKVEQLDDEVTTLFEIRFRTTKFTEHCHSDAADFVNEYWVGNKGLVRMSKQWHSPYIGFLLIERP